MSHNINPNVFFCYFWVSLGFLLRWAVRSRFQRNPRSPSATPSPATLASATIAAAAGQPSASTAPLTVGLLMTGNNVGQMIGPVLV
ncbi:hypothetical protein ACEN8K_46130, partial [Variovorax sp. CT11-76]